MTALTVYGTNFAATTLTTAALLADTSGTVTAVSVDSTIGTATGYGELCALGTSSAWAGAGSLPAPSGNGFLYDVTTLEGQTIAAGNWGGGYKVRPNSGTFTGTVICRISKRSSAGVYTTIATLTGASITFTTSTGTQSFTAVSGTATDFSTGDKLYVDWFINVTATTLAAGAVIHLTESATSATGSTNNDVSSPGYAATTGGSVALSGTLTSASTLAVTLSLANALSASMAGSSTLGVTLTLANGLGGTFTSVSTLSATLSLAIHLLATYTGQGVFSATLTNSSGVSFTPHFTSTSTFTATLNAPAPAHIAGTFTSAGTLTATFNTTVPLAASILSASALNVTLAATLAVPLAASLTSAATLSVTLRSAAPAHLSATVAINGSISVNLVSFVPTPKGLLITLSGQDITRWTRESSIDIEMALGSGPGTTNTGSGRAATAQFLTALGPAATAVGAGQIPPQTFIDTAIGADSPQGYWRLNEASGAVIDTSGNNINGSIVGGVMQGQAALALRDPNAGSYSFDGLTSYASLGDNVLPYGNSHWSVRATFVMASYPSDTFGTVLKWGAFATNESVYLSVSHTGFGQVSLTNVFTLTTMKPLLPGQKYSLTATYDGTTISLYLDGVLQASGVPGAALNLTNASATVGNIIGSSRGFAGNVAECAIYGNVISVAHMLTNAAIINRGAMPTLVRQGEVIIYDAMGNKIFGGKASKLTDQTDKVQNYTLIDCYDYWQDIARIVVNESYINVSDTFILNDLLAKYAPWIDASQIGTAQNYFFATKRLFRAKTLQQAFQDVLDVTGFQGWVDAYKVFHYAAPNAASTAPFGLSDQPDMAQSFPHKVTKYEQDDNAVINRATFYGGNKTSSDITQDLSPQANGNNTVFLLAYQPTIASDGSYHATVSGVEQVVGTAGASTLKSAGGTCDVLIDSTNQTATFNVAPTNAQSPTARYRYKLPMLVEITDQASYNYFGGYYDGVVSDTSVTDQQTAQQRLRVLLAEQNYGLLSLQVHCWQPGILPGQLVQITNAVRGLNKSYQVQKVKYIPLGAGYFAYEIDLGAWNWNLVDMVLNLGHAGQLIDNTEDLNTDVIQVQQTSVNISASITVSMTTTTTGQYYLRNAALNDGHDAWIGRSTLA